MERITGRFTYGPKPSTLDLVMQYEQDDDHPLQVALAEFSLHLPEGQRTKDDAYTEGAEDARKAKGTLAYDRDPGQVSLSCLALLRNPDPRRPFPEVTYVAVVDGHEMHLHGVFGSEAWIGWNTVLPARAVQPAITGEVTQVQVGGGAPGAE